ncbi:hypothetical protein UMZ34_21250 [Halopseudomonas pachastrellae]|nr:hypothetical protein UMZ34_21250 [Halopseudomonas pachastrellae]
MLMTVGSSGHHMMSDMEGVGAMTTDHASMVGADDVLNTML